ncbi:hypothetical protein [Sphingomonas xinjiangensis]|uniref:Uncharacterized protein n=1 Tax=Sphingomonas xinjiangensis TaxID=643568 RepID=A0A840YN73_9SPHN|nr:hypothetical protein [Sphingomonas xinjiangensis]MBB5711300.1 hypothetical protein [Sphingomonas xinjiangensis]
MPTQLAVLLVGMAARQAASPTARVQARIGMAAAAVTLLAPRHGCFHRAAAWALRAESKNEDGVNLGVLADVQAPADSKASRVA